MTDQDRDLISAVVLNWNGGQVLDNCLRSLYNQTYRPLEVVVVDNASTDGSVDLLKEKFQDVNLIINGKNLGFGAGNNVGIRASRGKYIMILNNYRIYSNWCICLYNEQCRDSLQN